MHVNLIIFTQVEEFIQCISGSSSLYGLQQETLDSLVLTLLPAIDCTHCISDGHNLTDDLMDIKVYILQELIQALKTNCGFHINHVS